MVSVGQDRTLRIWDVVGRKQLKSPSITSVAIALDISGIDQNFVTGHKSGDLRLWSLFDQKEIKKASHLHSSQVTCLKYTPDSTKIVSASRSDGIIVISGRDFSVLHSLHHAELSIP